MPPGPIKPFLFLNCIKLTRTFWFMRAQAVTIIVIEEAENYRKIVFIKYIVENGWWGPHPRRVSAPGYSQLANSHEYQATSQRFSYCDKNNHSSLVPDLSGGVP